MRKTLAFLILFLLISCGPIMKVIYGIHEPKVENEETLTEFVNKYNLKTDDIYTVEFQDFQPRNNFVKKIPNIFIFNNKGEEIEFRSDSAFCNGTTFDFITELSPKKTYKTENSKDFKIHSSNLLDLKGVSKSIELSEEYDFYVFIYWAKFLGKMNKEQTKVWETRIENNQNAKIKKLKINLDAQEHWGEENLKKLTNHNNG